MSWSLYNRKLSKPDLFIHHACQQCATFLPLSHLYFCVGCAHVLCPNCTTPNIDTYYCPSCLTSVFSSSAMNSQQRCDQCCQCPHCHSTLHPHYHSSTQTFSLNCLACHWNSQSLVTATNIPSLLASVKASESDVSLKAELASLAQSHKLRIRTLKQQQQQQRLSTIGQSQFIPNRSESQSGLTSAALFATAAARLGDESASSPLQKFLLLDSMVNDTRSLGYHANKQAATDLQSSESLLPPVPQWMSEGFTGTNSESTNDGIRSVDELTTLTQRLEHPALLGERSYHSTALTPRRQPLMTKLAHRCSTCTQYVVKPGANASKLTFEIQHSALSFAPRITIADYPTLALSKPTRLTLYVRNPVAKDFRLRVQCVTSVDDTNDDSAKSLVSALSLPSCAVSIINDWCWLPAYDDLAEIEHFNTAMTVAGSASKDSLTKSPYAELIDNPQLVASRSLSKVGLFVTVTPKASDMPVSFVLRCRIESLASSTGTAVASGYDALTIHIRISLGQAAATQSISAAGAQSAG